MLGGNFIKNMSDHHRPPKRKTATSTKKSNKSTNSLGTTSSDSTETAATDNSSHVKNDELTEDTTTYDKSSAFNDIEAQQSRSATTQFKASLNEILKKPKKKSKKHGQLYSLGTFVHFSY